MKYEYMDISIYDNDADDLNILGKDGWIMCGIFGEKVFFYRLIEKIKD